MGGQCCQLRAKTGTEATYAPAAAVLHLLHSALIMKRESSVGRWAFFNKITKAVFSPKQESKAFAVVSQHRDALACEVKLPPTAAVGPTAGYQEGEVGQGVSQAARPALFVGVSPRAVRVPFLHALLLARDLMGTSHR